MSQDCRRFSWFLQMFLLIFHPLTVFLVGIGFFGGREADNFFNILIVMAFLIFSTEIIAASLGVRGYFHSFFFYLDPGGEKWTQRGASGSLTHQEIPGVEDQTAAFFHGIWELEKKTPLVKTVKTQYCEPLIIYTPPFFCGRVTNISIIPMAAFFLQNLQTERKTVRQDSEVHQMQQKKHQKSKRCRTWLQPPLCFLTLHGLAMFSIAKMSRTYASWAW